MTIDEAIRTLREAGIESGAQFEALMVVSEQYSNNATTDSNTAGSLSEGPSQAEKGATE